MDGRVAVVTGAGSGIGKAAALQLAEEGANVLCAGRSRAVEETADAIGDSAVAVRVDVAIVGDVVRMIDTAEQRWGRLDVLVNNAGFGGDVRPLAEQDEESFDQVVAVNLRGVFLGMKYGIPPMLRNGGGSVVNVASAGGLMGRQGIAAYSAAKAGAITLTKTAALDYAESGVRANVVCPGAVWTPIQPSYTGDLQPPQDFRQSPAPLGRWGVPEEVASVIVFLASDESSFVTGTAIPVDGGITAGLHFPHLPRLSDPHTPTQQ